MVGKRLAESAHYEQKRVRSRSRGRGGEEVGGNLQRLRMTWDLLCTTQAQARLPGLTPDKSDNDMSP